MSLVNGHGGNPSRHTIMNISMLMSVSLAAEVSLQSQINLHRPTQKSSIHRKLPGAFNPALTAFDPNSSDYTHKDPSSILSSSNASASPQDYGAPADWIQCPPEVEGHRASYDCSAYIMCLNGEMSGAYLSCMGLKFDNSKGVCDWGEDVKCDSDKDVNTNGQESSDGEGGVTYAGQMETATAFRPMGGSFHGESSGKPEAAAWNGGSDWGGSWVQGVWYVLNDVLVVCLVTMD